MTKNGDRLGTQGVGPTSEHHNMIQELATIEIWRRVRELWIVVPRNHDWIDEGWKLLNALSISEEQAHLAHVPVGAQPRLVDAALDALVQRHAERRRLVLVLRARGRRKGRGKGEGRGSQGVAGGAAVATQGRARAGAPCRTSPWSAGRAESARPQSS